MRSLTLLLTLTVIAAAPPPTTPGALEIYVVDVDARSFAGRCSGRRSPYSGRFDELQKGRNSLISESRRGARSAEGASS